MSRALILGLVTLAIYASVVRAPFVYEDLNWVDQVNPNQAHGWLPWPDRAPWPNRWLTHMTYQWQSIQGNAEPPRYHVANVGLHLLCGLLVWIVARTWASRSGAFWATAIFLWHPLNTGAVAYVSGRADLLMTLLTLVAVAAVLKRDWWPWPIVLVACVLAGASKELGALSLALVLLSAGYGRAMLVAGLLVIPAGVYLVQWPALSTWIDLASANAVAVWRVLGLVVIPIGMSIDPDPWMAPMVLRVVALVGLAAAAVWAYRRELFVERWACAWIAVALLPRVVVPTYEPIHDHHAYLAMVPISVWLGVQVGGDRSWDSFDRSA